MHHAACNVKVNPVTVEQVTATFRPPLIPFIEAGGQIEVTPQIPGEGPLFKGGLPGLFRTSYKDSSAEELFGDKQFQLAVEFDDGGCPATLYATECQLLYRRWKDRIIMGSVRTRLRGSS
jgi:hypothetical protein